MSQSHSAIAKLDNDVALTIPALNAAFKAFQAHAKDLAGQELAVHFPPHNELPSNLGGLGRLMNAITEHAGRIEGYDEAARATLQQAGEAAMNAARTEIRKPAPARAIA